MLSTAFLTGNTVILALPNNLQQATPADSTEWLISCATIAGLNYVADEYELFRLNKILPNKSGPLTQFISETDLFSFATISEQYFLLRFITERTRSINTTPVG